MMSKIIRGGVNAFRSFFIEGIILSLLVGYGFYYVLTTIYPQIADNYLYLGIVLVVWILFVSVSTKVAKRLG
jgi:hypothetical protein